VAKIFYKKITFPNPSVSGIIYPQSQLLHIPPKHTPAMPFYDEYEIVEFKRKQIESTEPLDKVKK